MAEAVQAEEVTTSGHRTFLLSPKCGHFYCCLTFKKNRCGRRPLPLLSRERSPPTPTPSRRLAAALPSCENATHATNDSDGLPLVLPLPPDRRGFDRRRPRPEAGRFQPRREADPRRQVLRLPRPRRRQAQGQAPPRRQGPTPSRRSSSPATRRAAHSFQRIHGDDADRGHAAAHRQDGAAVAAADRPAPPLDRPGGEVRACTGPTSSRCGRPCRTVKNKAWVPQRHRRLHRRRPGAPRLSARAGGRPRHADPPAQLRPDRPAADAGGGRRLRQRPGPDAYEKLVDRLLASPHYGERMADLLARPGPLRRHRPATTATTTATSGCTAITSSTPSTPTSRSTGSPSSSWPATCCPTRPIEQRIASGYNRLLQTTEEGGAQAKEYTAKYAADRVRNVSVGLAGLDDGLRRVPRPQVRSVHDQGFLQLRGVLRRREGDGRRPAGADAVPVAGAGGGCSKLDEQIAAAKAALDAADAGAGRGPGGVGEDGPRRQAPAKPLPADVTAALAVEPAKRTPQQKQAVADLLPHGRAAAGGAARPAGRSSQRTRSELIGQFPTTLVTTAGAAAHGPPPAARQLAGRQRRGRARRPCPAFLRRRWTAKDRRATRLDLAQLARRRATTR